MKREIRRERLLKTLLLGHWISTGFDPSSMATVIDIQSVLQDPYAYVDIVLGTRDRETVNKTLDAIMDGNLETHINDAANALREKDDYTSTSSIHATKDMLDAMNLELHVRDSR